MPLPSPLDPISTNEPRAPVRIGPTRFVQKPPSGRSEAALLPLIVKIFSLPNLPTRSPCCGRFRAAADLR